MGTVLLISWPTLQINYYLAWFTSWVTILFLLLMKGFHNIITKFQLNKIMTLVIRKKWKFNSFTRFGRETIHAHRFNFFVINCDVSFIVIAKVQIILSILKWTVSIWVNLVLEEKIFKYTELKFNWFNWTECCIKQFVCEFIIRGL